MYIILMLARMYKQKAGLLTVFRNFINKKAGLQSCCSANSGSGIAF